MSAYTELTDAILEIAKSAIPSLSYAIREEQMRRRNWRNEVGSGEIPVPFLIFSCARLTRTDLHLYSLTA